MHRHANSNKFECIQEHADILQNKKKLTQNSPLLVWPDDVKARTFIEWASSQLRNTYQMNWQSSNTTPLQALLSPTLPLLIFPVSMQWTVLVYVIMYMLCAYTSRHTNKHTDTHNSIVLHYQWKLTDIHHLLFRVFENDSMLRDTQWP